MEKIHSIRSYFHGTKGTSSSASGIMFSVSREEDEQGAVILISHKGSVVSNFLFAVMSLRVVTSKQASRFGVTWQVRVNAACR
jgi:hypothetical protein